MESSIELKGVSLRRGDMWILRDVFWSVPSGACAAILGPNGSGKSTLTRILAGHLWPTGGDVRVAGGVFGETSLPELRRHIRLVQSAGPYDVDPQLTAVEAVLTGFFGSIGLYEAVTDTMRVRAESLLASVGLSHVASHTYATLSSGERVRTLIARALVEWPRLLLLDEPTAGLDLLAREQVLATVQRLITTRDPKPPTVLMITHHVEELPPATSHVLLLSKGQVAASGTPAEVLRAEVLSPVYGCPLEVRWQGERCYVEVHPGQWDALLPTH